MFLHSAEAPGAVLAFSAAMSERVPLWCIGSVFLKNLFWGQSPPQGVGARQPSQSETPLIFAQLVGRELNNHLCARCDRHLGSRLRQVASGSLDINAAHYVDCFTGRWGSTLRPLESLRGRQAWWDPALGVAHRCSVWENPGVSAPVPGVADPHSSFL